MSFNAGVCVASLVDSTARYCRYRDAPETTEPELIGANAVHVASGTGVFPSLTLIESDVAAGTVLVHVAAPQVRLMTPSKTRDVKDPVGA